MPFKKGNTLGKTGRPRNTPNLLTRVKELIMKEGYKRVKTRKFWESINNNLLLDAMLKLIPREDMVKVDTNITYNTNIGIAVAPPLLLDDRVQTIDAELTSLGIEKACLPDDNKEKNSVKMLD